MASETHVPAGEYVPTADQRVITYCVPWSHFEKQLELRGENSSPRLAYLDGALEIMSPSKDHERIKSYIGRLIEAFALERDIDLSPYGGWTLKKEMKKAGLEPDECYLVGDQDRDKPDLAIEVVWTSGGLDKLEIYRRIGVQEVWRWKNGKISIYLLRGERYEPAEQSSTFSDLDVDGLCTFLEYPTVTQAIRSYQEKLRSK